MGAKVRVNTERVRVNQRRGPALITSQPNRDALRRDPALMNAEVDAMVRTHKEVIAERMLSTLIVRHFNTLLDPASHRVSSPSRIESSVVDNFHALLPADFSETMFEKEIGGPRNEFRQLVEEIRSGSRSLLRDDLLPVLSQDLEAVERDGSDSDKTVARYFHALKTTLAQHMVHESFWAYAHGHDLHTTKSFNDFSEGLQRDIAAEILEDVRLRLIRGDNVYLAIGQTLAASMITATVAVGITRGYGDMLSLGEYGVMTVSIISLILGSYLMLGGVKRGNPLTTKEIGQDELAFLNNWAKRFETALDPERQKAIAETKAHCLKQRLQQLLQQPSNVTSSPAPGTKATEAEDGSSDSHNGKGASATRRQKI
ncbi:MAG: hypothetical protein KKB81_08040 [Candidatus Margulisbacteria bacterium]|nr:hypothetical protein [Candidatus Margulisiibacteriota bacterium]MBU1021755.1 hypothetical protein [Candidatus Margulisiibacteriota bacterium]MBU1729501.1 hypothetical protein [Candidatus Margulisiibacteriota bacterium]MBU1955398.1 hypothetical protein [Candidatus Margulisiibacteriota bacterium]